MQDFHLIHKIFVYEPFLKNFECVLHSEFNFGQNIKNEIIRWEVWSVGRFSGALMKKRCANNSTLLLDEVTKPSPLLRWGKETWEIFFQATTTKKDLLLFTMTNNFQQWGFSLKILPVCLRNNWFVASYIHLEDTKKVGQYKINHIKCLHFKPIIYIHFSMHTFFL